MHHKVPDGHFHGFFLNIFSESKFYAIYNGEIHFQIRGLVAELHVFRYGGKTFGTFEKTCFKMLMLKTSMLRQWGGVIKIMFLTMKHGKVGYYHVTD